MAKNNIHPVSTLRRHLLSRNKIDIFKISVPTHAKGSYAFTLFTDTGLRASRHATVQFALSVNTGPSGGVVDVTPKTGQTMSTLFQIRHTRAWKDADLPIRYRFSLSVRSSSGETNTVYLHQAFAFNSFINNARFPVPGRCPDFLATLRVEVADRFGAASACGSASQPECAAVTVAPYTGSAKVLETILRSQLQQDNRGVFGTVIAIKRLAANASNACPSLVEPSWSDWSPCNRQCGRGQSSRQRRHTCTPPPGPQGQTTPNTQSNQKKSHCTAAEKRIGARVESQQRVCELVACDASWTSWSACSARCSDKGPGRWDGVQRRHRLQAAEERYCGVTCPVPCPNNCQNRGVCVREPQLCVDPESCSAVCNCAGTGHTGAKCDVAQHQVNTLREDNERLLSLIWQAYTRVPSSCMHVHNALVAMEEVVAGELDLIANRQRLYTRVLDATTRTACAEAVESITLDLVDLLPPFLRRLRFNSANKLGTGSRDDGSRDEDDAASPERLRLLDALDQINSVFADRALATQVPNQTPVEVNKREIKRLTVVQWADEPLGVCSKNDAFCAIYPPDVFGQSDQGNSLQGNSLQGNNLRQRRRTQVTSNNQTRPFTKKVRERLGLAMWRIRSPIHDTPPHSAASITHRLHVPRCARSSCASVLRTPSNTTRAGDTRNSGTNGASNKRDVFNNETNYDNANDDTPCARGGSCPVATPFGFSLLNVLPKSVRRGRTACGYWDVRAQEWSTRGLFLLGIAVDGGSRGVVMNCKATHMTDMIAMNLDSASTEISYNRVDFASPLHMHRNYDHTNSFILYVLVATSLVGVSLLVLARVLDEKRREETDALEERTYLVGGEIQIKYGRPSRVHLLEAILRFCVQQRMAEHLREADSELHLGLISAPRTCCKCKGANTMAFWKPKLKLLYAILRAENTLVAFAHPPDKELVYFSRFQRVACYVTEIFMSFMMIGVFVNAQQPHGYASIGSALLVVALLFPVTYVAPWMFQAAQTFRSDLNEEIDTKRRRITEEIMHTSSAIIRRRSSSLQEKKKLKSRRTSIWPENMVSPKATEAVAGDGGDAGGDGNDVDTADVSTRELMPRDSVFGGGPRSMLYNQVLDAQITKTPKPEQEEKDDRRANTTPTVLATTLTVPRMVVGPKAVAAVSGPVFNSGVSRVRKPQRVMLRRISSEVREQRAAEDQAIATMDTTDSLMATTHIDEEQPARGRGRVDEEEQPARAKKRKQIRARQSSDSDYHTYKSSYANSSVIFPSLDDDDDSTADKKASKKISNKTSVTPWSRVRAVHTGRVLFAGLSQSDRQKQSFVISMMKRNTKRARVGSLTQSLKDKMVAGRDRKKWLHGVLFNEYKTNEEIKVRRMCMLALVYGLLGVLSIFSIFTTVTLGATLTNQDQLTWTNIVLITFLLDLFFFSFLRVVCLWLVPPWLLLVLFGVSTASLLSLVFFCSDLIGNEAGLVCSFIPL